jgi:MutS domain III
MDGELGDGAGTPGHSVCAAASTAEATLHSTLCAHHHVEGVTSSALHCTGRYTAGADAGEPQRRGSMLHLIDRCATPAGSRLLRRWLTAPLADKALIEQRQEAVQVELLLLTQLLLLLLFLLLLLCSTWRVHMAFPHATGTQSAPRRTLTCTVGTATVAAAAAAGVIEFRSSN